MSALQASCSMPACPAAATWRCPRCEQLFCQNHGRVAGEEHCQGCEQAIVERVDSHLAGRALVGIGAGLAGAAVGEVMVLMMAAFLGLGPEIIILLMLMAGLGCGSVPLYLVDQRMHRWLRRRAANELGALPEARLLAHHNRHDNERHDNERHDS